MESHARLEYYCADPLARRALGAHAGGATEYSFTAGYCTAIGRAAVKGMVGAGVGIRRTAENYSVA